MKKWPFKAICTKSDHHFTEHQFFCEVDIPVRYSQPREPRCCCWSPHRKQEAHGHLSTDSSSDCEQFQSEVERREAATVDICPTRLCQGQGMPPLQDKHNAGRGDENRPMHSLKGGELKASTDCRSRGEKDTKRSFLCTLSGHHSRGELHVCCYSAALWTEI